MTFIFRHMTIFWDIFKWNRGQKKWEGGSKRWRKSYVVSFALAEEKRGEKNYSDFKLTARSNSTAWPIKLFLFKFFFLEKKGYPSLIFGNLLVKEWINFTPHNDNLFKSPNPQTHFRH